MSPLAEAAFGSYDLQVPDGIDIEDIHDFEAPGNELGYVARLSPQRATGIARRFIRADVAVNAKDDTDPDVIPESDVDRVLSEAESRVESEFFLESDITKAGLGAWVPYVDFNVGDIVNVRIFDIWVKLPVTRIEPIISEGDVVDWRVHVGGQLLSDDQAREVENATIQRELIQDRRDLAGIDAKATKAVKDSSEAKSTADQAKQATEDNRTYIDEQLDAAGAAVEQGRQYLLQMEEHVTAGNIAAGLAEDLAGQAAAAATEAVSILDQLDPLRDDVDAAHAEVVRLHGEASQFTDQAAGHVLLASQHAADAQGYAQQALEHEDEGRRQATAALNAAGAAQDSAAAAQSILDDADGILSQVSGYSQQAQDALSGAENLLANAGGSGKSLGDVLLEVAQKHQETLTAHDNILDLHGEVLQKHGEAIRYVAIAAAQASVAAQHAAQAAQEALNVAADAARAAASAGEAADEAAQAASNNSAAISKLEEADGKLQEADEKLQQQMLVLEESQRMLARAVQILASAVAQAAAAAQHAIQAAESAGDAAGSALDAAESNSKAIAILNYERTRLVMRMNPQEDPSGNNKPPGVGTFVHYGSPTQNEFVSIDRAAEVQESNLQVTSPSGPVHRNFRRWEFTIHLHGNWSGFLSWEAATGAIQDYNFTVMTVNIKNGEVAGARAFLDDPANTDAWLRSLAEGDLKKITALTSGGALVVRVNPEYEEGKTNLGPYMP